MPYSIQDAASAPESTQALVGACYLYAQHLLSIVEITIPHPPFLIINQDAVNVFDFCHGGLAKYWSCAWRRRKFAIEFISTRGHSYNTTHTAMAPLKCIKLVSVVISLRANFHCMHSYHSSCSTSMLWCTRSRHIDFHDLSLCNCSVHVKRFPWLINPSIYTFLPSLPWSVDC